MNASLRQDANAIIQESIFAVQPDAAVRRALQDADFSTGRVLMVAAGKAAWRMAKAACDVLGDRLEHGVVCTKYGHVTTALNRVDCFEGGHPVPDENSFRGTQPH